MQFWKFSTSAIAALLASVSIVSAGGDSDSSAIASADSAVLQVTAKNFEETLEQNPLVLLEFFAPWCGHCKTLGPEFVKAAEELSVSLPDVKLGQINCVEEEDLCRSQEIRGYPTMKLARGNTQQLDDYEGPREAQGIVDYMVKMSQDPVTIVSDVVEFIETIKSEIKPFVVQILPEAAKKASDKLNDTFGKIADVHRKFRTHYSIDTDSAIAEFAKLINVDISGDKAKYLIVHPDQLDDVRLFDGEELNAETFDEWVSNAQVPDFGDINRDTYLIYMDAPLPLGYYFYNSTEQRAEVAEFFATTAKELRGKINFVGLDATQFGRHAEILNMDPEIVPLFAIQDNSNGKKYGLNQTEHPNPSTEAIKEFVNQFLAGEIEPIVKSEPLPTPEDEDYDENVHKLVAHNYDELFADENKNIFVEYYAPWCGHCKNLAPIWSELGAHYKATDENVVIAKIDHTSNDVALTHQIEGYPTIIFYPANGEKDPKTGLRVGVVYQQARELEALKAYVEEFKVPGSEKAEESKDSTEVAEEVVEDVVEKAEEVVEDAVEEVAEAVEDHDEL